MIFEEPEARQQISPADFAYLNSMVNSDHRWFLGQPVDVVEVMFRDHFGQFMATSGVGQAAMMRHVERAQALLEGSNSDPGFCMQFPMGMCGLSDVHNNTYLVS